MDILNSSLAKLRNCFRRIFPYNTDGCIETIDSLSSNISAKPHIEITLNPLFTRSHTTLSHVVSRAIISREMRMQLDLKN